MYIVIRSKEYFDRECDYCPTDFEVMGCFKREKTAKKCMLKCLLKSINNHIDQIERELLPKKIITYFDKCEKELLANKIPSRYWKNYFIENNIIDITDKIETVRDFIEKFFPCRTSDEGEAENFNIVQSFRNAHS